MMPPGQGMFSQMAQGQAPQGIPHPPMPPQGGAPMPQGAAPPPPPQGPPPVGGGGIPPQILQMLMQAIQQQKAQAPQQIAQQGRGGDNMIAHLTPGEIMVPPQVQTHKVLATLHKAYKDHGVSPAQFTAGNPHSSMNPKTGVPEYNFMSAFLPAALGVAGSVVAPYLAPEAMSALMASSIGGGVGSAVGGVASGQTPTQAALGGLGAGAGSYALGGGLSGLMGDGAKIPTVDQALAMKMSKIDPTTVGFGASNAAAGGAGSTNALMNAPMSAGTVQQTYPGISGAIRNATTNPNPLAMAGGALGGMAGSAIGAPPISNKPNLPPGFNDSMPPVGSLGSAQQQLGQTNSVQPRPTFTGYNPATNNPAAFNFYPGSQ